MIRGLLLLIFFCVPEVSLGETPPQNQDDLYLWKAPYPKMSLARFVNVNGYRFGHRSVPSSLHERVQQAKKKDFGETCEDHTSQDWPIYLYSLGVDGQLLLVSCMARSTKSWSVYYHRTPKDELKPISVRVPILSIGETGVPYISGFHTKSILENSEVLQRRLLSRYHNVQPPSYHDRAEWIWKEGHGLVLIEYSVVRYDQDGSAQEFILYPEGSK